MIKEKIRQEARVGVFYAKTEPTTTDNAMPYSAGARDQLLVMFPLRDAVHFGTEVKFSQIR